MWKVTLSEIDFDEQEIEAVTKVLRSKWVSMGEITHRFEKKFAEYVGAKYAFAVCNGTAALHLAHRALGIQEGDEVILPSLTFVAAANAVIYCRAQPRFADVTSETDLTISPADVEEKISLRTKAISIMHYGGYPCQMVELLALAEKHNLSIIEDACHAPGSEYRGKKLGTFGVVGCFSFFANKNMTTGEGGMIVTNDAAIADKIQLMRSHGMTSLSWDRYQGHAHTYDVVEFGYNYRVDEIRSAVGLVQLDKLESNNRRRSHIVQQYRELLSVVEEIQLPFKDVNGTFAYHLFPILLSRRISRENFVGVLKEKGIQTSLHYPPIHFFRCYRQRYGHQSPLPHTEAVAQRLVTLPLYAQMTSEQVHYVCATVAEACSIALQKMKSCDRNN